MKAVAVSVLVLHCAIAINGAQIFAHLMPWFETKDSNGGTWGIHWTMANRNPDNIVDGQQDIASFYHPQIGAYASGDSSVIDWQLGTMKTAGFAGTFIDWPGTTQYADYPRNRQNAEAVIQGTQRNGLQFAVVYEDNNLNLAGVGDKIGQGTSDMNYLQDNYFNSGNYVRVNGAPLLLDFGPQALTDGGQWDQIFANLNPQPVFLTLWYQHQQGGNSNQGEFAWIYSDFMDGLNNWYNNVDLPVKVGVAYPGFQPFYANGGWPGPDFTIEYGTNTFQQTLNLAVSHTDIVQIATWNDYGEGTIVEPTVEYGTQFVDIVRSVSGTKYTKEDTQEVYEIFLLRKQHANNATMQEHLTKRFQNLMTKFD